MARKESCAHAYQPIKQAKHPRSHLTDKFDQPRRYKCQRCGAVRPEQLPTKPSILRRWLPWLAQ